MFFKEHIISEKTNGEIFINIFLTMIRNLETFASMVFDINVINKILVSRSKRMIVYAGINHVNRISALLTNNDDVSIIGANMRAPFTLVDNLVTSGISVRDSLPLPMDVLPQELLAHFLSVIS